MQPPQGPQIMLSHRSVFLRDPWVVFNNVSVTMMLLAEREAGFKARCMPGIFCTLSYSFLRLSQSLTYTAIVKQSSELPLATDHSSPSHTNSTTTAVCLSAAAVYRAASPCSPSCLKPHQTSPVVQLWCVSEVLDALLCLLSATVQASVLKAVPKERVTLPASNDGCPEYLLEAVKVVIVRDFCCDRMTAWPHFTSSGEREFQPKPVVANVPFWVWEHR